MTTYIISSLLWFVAGVGLGLVAGLHVRGMSRQGRADVNHPRTDGSRQRRRYRLTSTQALGMVVVLMALMSTLLVGIQNTCQTRYFETYGETLKSRDTIAARSRQDSKALAVSNKELWLALVRNSDPDPAKRPTAEQRQASLQALQVFLSDVDEYVAALDALDQARVVYPIPANECPALGWLP